jgi:hypothetical protein
MATALAALHGSWQTSEVSDHAIATVLARTSSAAVRAVTHVRAIRAQSTSSGVTIGYSHVDLPIVWVDGKLLADDRIEGEADGDQHRPDQADEAVGGGQAGSTASAQARPATASPSIQKTAATRTLVAPSKQRTPISRAFQNAT